MAIAYGILAKSAMEVHSEAMGNGLPVPHADSLFDDGLPSEEADEYDDRDREPEQDNKVIVKPKTTKLLKNIIFFITID